MNEEKQQPSAQAENAQAAEALAASLQAQNQMNTEGKTGEQGAAPAQDLVNQKPSEATTSPYDEEITRLNKLAEHQREIIGRKERALQAEKERRKKAESTLLNTRPSEESLVENSEESLTNRVQEEMRVLREEQQTLREALHLKTQEDEIARLTKDPKEQEAIRLHLKYSVKSTGNFALDAQNAQLLANRHKIYQEGLQEGLQARKEDVLAGYSMSRSTSGGYTSPNKVDEGAAQILRNLGMTKAIEFLDKK